MGFDAGWAALNMEMPDRVPRTEYSADTHWDLVTAVTGIEVGVDSAGDLQARASQRFRREWDYCMNWNVLVHRQVLSTCRTDMGHAEYAAGGTDYRGIGGCPFETPEEVLAFDPMETYGPVDKAEWGRKFEEHYARSQATNSDAVNMSGTYITLFSGLIEIFGWNMLLMGAGTDMVGFGKVAERYAAWMMPFFEAYAETDIPVMMAHDDIVWTSGPVLPPEWYRTYIFPAYKRMWRPVLDAGKRLIYTSDGTYSMFFDDVVQAGAHTLVMEPSSDMASFAEKYGKTHGFIGNADTRILLSGTREQIRAEVERCMAIGKSCPGFIMAVGNHIPSNTPVENALYYNEVYEELAQR